MVHMEPVGAAAGVVQVAIAYGFVDENAVGLADVGDGRDLKVEPAIIHLADFGGSEFTGVSNKVHYMGIVGALRRSKISGVKFDGGVDAREEAPESRDPSGFEVG